MSDNQIAASFIVAGLIVISSPIHYSWRGKWARRGSCIALVQGFAGLAAIVVWMVLVIIYR